MTNQLFEKAKQAVAEKHGFEDPAQLFNNLSFWEDVFKYGCNEAVNADRDRILNQSFPDSKRPDSIYLIEASAVYGDIPFPQQPDER